MRRISVCLPIIHAPDMNREQTQFHRTLMVWLTNGLLRTPRSQKITRKHKLFCQIWLMKRGNRTRACQFFSMNRKGKADVGNDAQFGRRAAGAECVADSTSSAKGSRSDSHAHD